MGTVLDSVLAQRQLSTEHRLHERSLFKPDQQRIPDLRWATKANGAFPWDCPAFEAFRERGDARRKQQAWNMGCGSIMDVDFAGDDLRHFVAVSCTRRTYGLAPSKDELYLDGCR